MPEIWMDVDAALAEVPVNKVALIDDSDFKSREESVTYDQAGMDLVWNFVTTAGAMTQTAVTPTTGGGDYDWTNQGNGMYSIGMTASGGASINNDTEGFGWFTGFATGILPWTGPIIGFRAAGLNNLLIDSAYSATQGLSGTNLDAAITSRAVAGDNMNLADDAITAAKYDESTAFPIKSDDSGATQIARVGADGDTLETLSDQLDLTALASVCTEARLGELDAANIPADVDTLLSRLSAARAGYLDELAAANIPADIDTLLTRIVGTLAAGDHNPQSGDAYAKVVTYLETALTEPAYPAKGDAVTYTQAIYMILSRLLNFVDATSTTPDSLKINGVDVAMSYEQDAGATYLKRT